MTKRLFSRNYLENTLNILELRHVVDLIAFGDRVQVIFRDLDGEVWSYVQKKTDGLPEKVECTLMEKKLAAVEHWVPKDGIGGSSVREDDGR